MSSDWLYGASSAVVLIATLAQLFFAGPSPSQPASGRKKIAIIAFYLGMTAIWLLVAAADVRDGERMSALLHVSLAGLFAAQGLRGYRQGRLAPVGLRGFA